LAYFSSLYHFHIIFFNKQSYKSRIEKQLIEHNSVQAFVVLSTASITKISIKTALTGVLLELSLAKSLDA
jgi:hypothetical protein